MATLSLLGLYNYDQTIFDGLIAKLPSEQGLPKEYPESYQKGIVIDSDALIDELLFQTAEQEILYTNPGFLKLAISSWAKKQAFTWQALYNTICFSYNPIWNKDGTVSWTEEESGSGKSERKKTGLNSQTEQIKTEGTDTSNAENSFTDSSKNDTTVTNSVSAYNASDFQNRDKSVTGSSVTGSQTGKGKQDISSSHSTSNTVSGNSEESDSATNSDSRKKTHTSSESGNIGVTMTQDMIAKEREIAQFNMIDFIIADFKKRFVLAIY